MTITKGSHTNRGNDNNDNTVNSPIHPEVVSGGSGGVV